MAETNAVSIKLPTFWTTQPHVWFQQAEAQFTIRGVTADQTMYAYVVAALDQDTASRLLDLLSHPPDTNKYVTIKARLLKTFGLSRRVRANKLLNLDDLGDRMPSALMDEMLSLLDGHQPCMLFEQLFLNRMPDPIRLQLAEADFSDPRKVAELADQLWLAMEHGPAIHKATYQHRQSRPKPTAQAKPDNTKSNADWCFYHQRFGEKAKKCVQPCKYPGNTQAGRQ